jgi:amidohydrolase
MDIAETVSVRHHLHEHPDLSGSEDGTAKYLIDYLKSNYPNCEIAQSEESAGFIASINFGKGPHLAFRAELDGLPIQETNDFSHQSKRKNKSHACGHDGHMTILLSTLAEIVDHSPKKGRVSLLFQPAEETGKGALQMLDDAVFSRFNPDVLIALHNIPKQPLGKVLSRKDTFACGSAGVILNIEGITAHAAHPEDAVNPLLLAVDWLTQLNDLVGKMKEFALATPISIRSGDHNFGVTPSHAELLVTLRSSSSQELSSLMRETESMAEQLALENGVKVSLHFEDFFPVTSNSTYHDLLEDVCSEYSIDFEEMEEPFRWSEDFGHYSKLCSTLMFGLGAGISCPHLHSAEYDFPDSLIEIGSSLFSKLFFKIINDET